MPSPATKGHAQRLEAGLNDFDPGVRRDALHALCDAAERGEIALPPARPRFNLHCHSFFSYNGYGLSPSALLWEAKKRGLEMSGLVDFDVLDGLREFREGGRVLGIKTCVNVESRVFVPSFRTRVINSPGEPGIAYHMGAGFVRESFAGETQAFLDDMRNLASQRNRDLVERVNRHLDPLPFDYDREAASLTPAGNATERHICLAYARRAAEAFPDPEALRAFWTEKLGPLPDDIDLPEGPTLQTLIRAKTMKRGGIGYVQPGEGSFPTMADMDRFTLSAGAIPTLTWLDGTSEAEQSIEALARTAAASGVAALNIIPDRNFTPGRRDRKLENLYEVVDLARALHWPILIGTEMNSPGQKHVDDLDSAELAPLVPAFREGGHILCAHSLLQEAAGMGYLSPWAQTHFADAEQKNRFYAQVGAGYDPCESPAGRVNESMTPAAVLEQL